MWTVDRIAGLLTEDPDVLSEFDLGQPEADELPRIKTSPGDRYHDPRRDVEELTDYPDIVGKTGYPHRGVSKILGRMPLDEDEYNQMVSRLLEQGEELGERFRENLRYMAQHPELKDAFEKYKGVAVWLLNDIKRDLRALREWWSAQHPTEAPEIDTSKPEN